MNAKNINKYQEYKEQTKQSDNLADELIQTALKDCVSLPALQEACQKFAINFSNIAYGMMPIHLDMGFDRDEAEELIKKWMGSRMESLDAMYADASQRFATVH